MKRRDPVLALSVLSALDLLPVAPGSSGPVRTTCASAVVAGVVSVLARPARWRSCRSPARARGGDGLVDVTTDDPREPAPGDAVAVQDDPVERDLRMALAAGHVRAWFQPVVSVTDGRVEGVEALARWHHPERGMVPPVEFVPVAERAGLVGELGAEMLRQSLAQLRRWDDELGPRAPRYVAVNLSPRELHDAALPGRVRDLLAANGLAPERLVLEVTETAVMDDPEQATLGLAALSELGVRLALDDFATVHSSLSRLGNLPVDVVKVDGSFVMALDEQRTVVLVDATVRLARGLGLVVVVAEGVETPEQAELLRLLGTQYLQGYLLARPAPAAALAASLSGAVPLPAGSTGGAEDAVEADPSDGDDVRPVASAELLARTREAVGQQVVAAALAELDFRLVVVNLARRHGVLEVVALGGAQEVPEAAASALAVLHGQVIDGPVWEQLLADGTATGPLVFSGHLDDGAPGHVTTWVSDSALPGSRTSADAWHPLDAFYVVLRTGEGALRTVLSFDIPRSWRRPDRAQRRALRRFAAATEAALAVVPPDDASGRVPEPRAASHDLAAC